jgi:hypothetical protein
MIPGLFFVSPLQRGKEGNMTQTREQIAALIGRKRVDCPAVNYAYNYAMLRGYVVLGAWRGTAKYMGKIAMQRVRARYPGIVDYVQVSRGRQMGEDTFVAYGKAVQS